MSPKYSYFGFVWIIFLTVIQNGLSVQCYSCAWDNLKEIQSTMTYGVSLTPNCASPFNSTGVEIQECAGVCIDATATVDIGILGKDQITLKTCAQLNSCQEFGLKLEEMVKPLHVTSYFCGHCNTTLCNAGHRLQLQIVSVLAAFLIAGRLLH